MDVSFSAKTQTLALISSIPLSSASSPSLFCSLRREFLGCGHRLRPPGLLSRRKCKKLGFHIQSPRYFFRASLFSQPIIVVVAVATFSALTIVCWNLTRRKKGLRGYCLRDSTKLGFSQSPYELVLVGGKQGLTNGLLGQSLGIVLNLNWTEVRFRAIHGLDGSGSTFDSHCVSGSRPWLGSGSPSLGFNEGPKDPDSLETRAISKQSRVVESQIMGSREFTGEVHMKERRYTPDETRAKGHASDGKEVQLSQLQKTDLMHEETLITEASHSPDSDVLASSANGFVSTKETEVAGLTLPLMVLGKSGVLEPESSAMELSKLQVEGRRKETGLDTELPLLVAETTSSVSGITIEDALAEKNQYYIPKHEVGEEGELQVSGYRGFFRESVREELYTFYGDNQSGVRSISNFNGLKTISPCTSLPDSNSFSSLIRLNTPKGTELLTQDSHRITEYLEDQIPLACYKEDSSRKRKNFEKGREFSRDLGSRDLPQNGYRVFPEFPQPNGMHFNDKHDPSEYLSAYNRLLRGGRLTDCIELLEDMERRGLLDMDKVYHARFLKTCKSQKAVKEAFRFTKLIPNPTLSTFNMLLSVCASSKESEGAFQVLRLVKEAKLKVDCKLYTTLISTCAKSGKVDAMFEVFHEMVNAKVEPNVQTYGALIDGCARAGQVAKAFGAYGIMRSKKVKPDRIIFNALITACGQSGAVDRAFDVLAEMRAETEPIDPDHITVGALIKTCAVAGQVDRAREVYKMIHQYNIKGTPEVYTIAVNSCSHTGDLEFALSVYNDMTRNDVVPDEMFLSALIDVAGHAGKVDVAFKIIQDARIRGIRLGNVSYSSLMGACSNAKNWQKALELYEDIKAIKLHPTVSTMNALVTALCDGDQLQKAVEVLAEMKKVGVCPNTITYSILVVASEKKDALEIGFMLLSQAKKDGVIPNLVMCRGLTGMCLRRYEKAYTLGESVLSFNSGRPQIDNKCSTITLKIFERTTKTNEAGVVPTMEVFSQVLGCLQLTSLRNRLVENLGVSTDSSKGSKIYSLIDGFGEYDSRSFSLLEEAASLGVVPCVSFKESPIVVDARKFLIHTAEVYLLTILKGLKHRFAAGAKLPNITVLLPIERTCIPFPKGEKMINMAGRVGQAVGALLRRLGLPYQGNESYGKIRISGLAVKRWFQPRLASPFSGKPVELSSSQTRLGKEISHQQRNIRTGNLK
ncbi:hypothetical protein HHK36_010260 [Tetracentron sinense]|uniref:PROP1-like PPR domain-containing protein n=1 Tax=Tetracentron sinense TaxID=13715 RepID=A0A834ZEN1_TETSI|nr:hypothetical protein HHK36_010260 [Tetracentron sinense]